MNSIPQDNLSFYIREVQRHAQKALCDFIDLEAEVAATGAKNPDEIWLHITGFLTHAAMISKYIDSPASTPQAKNRGELLASALGIDHESPILPRHSRNNIEHFDERLDSILSDNSAPLLIEKVSYTLDREKPLASIPYRVLRIFVINELAYLSEDGKGNLQNIQLKTLEKEIQRIMDCCVEWADTRPLRTNP